MEKTARYRDSLECSSTICALFCEYNTYQLLLCCALYEDPELRCVVLICCVTSYHGLGCLTNKHFKLEVNKAVM